MATRASAKNPASKLKPKPKTRPKPQQQSPDDCYAQVSRTIPRIKVDEPSTNVAEDCAQVNRTTASIKVDEPSTNIAEDYATGRPKGISKRKDKSSSSGSTYENLEESSMDKNKVYKMRQSRLRKHLKLYFYTAIKWTGNTFSFHPVYFLILLLQFIKVTLLTSQMFDFGYDHAKFSEVVNRGHLVLRHLLLKDWDTSWETLNYPPAQGDFAVYRVEDLVDSINFAVQNFYSVESNATGLYNRTSSDKMDINLKYFDFPNTSLSTEQGVRVTDVSVPIPDEEGQKYDIIKEFQDRGLTTQLTQRMLSLVLHFTLHSVRVSTGKSGARCLRVEGWIQFTDPDNNGQVEVNLETLTTRIRCATINITVADMALENTNRGLGGVLVLFCLLSLIVTALNIIYAGYVFRKTKQFMKQHYREFYNPVEENENDLPPGEYWRFFKLWDVTVFVSDILTLYGTIEIVFVVEEIEYIVETLDAFTVWLALGCILAWLSLLRFFKFHNKFHLLFSTLYRAFWDVMAYLFCVGVLFAGFWVAGFVVLGPYHVKFRTPGRAAETLLSIVHGDEIYATIAILEEQKTGGKWVYYFTRFYVGAYVGVFTIVVINLLIAIYMNAYDSIREYYNEKPEERDLGPMEKALRRYLTENQELPQDGTHLNVEAKDKMNLRKSICSLLIDDGKLSAGENSLRKELQKLVKVGDSKKDVVLLRPRTLKAFMIEEDDEKTTITVCCINLSFDRFFHKW